MAVINSSIQDQNTSDILIKSIFMYPFLNENKKLCLTNLLLLFYLRIIGTYSFPNDDVV